MVYLSTSEPASESQPVHKQLQVVIVDDDPSVLGTITRFVKALGHEAISFDNFEQARVFIGSNNPDAFVVDIRLGTYNGLQLVHLARQLNAHARVVAVSGFEDLVLREEAARAGAHFLIKPFTVSDLEHALTSLAGPTPV